MNPKDVKFKNEILIATTQNNVITINFARANSIDDLKSCKNLNLNGSINNTFIWIEDKNKLIYRNSEGQEYKVKFKKNKN
jgi:hypothetical protein